MAKRSTPIRLEVKLLQSLDRFIVDWNRGGAPSTNRTLVITTAIEQYLKYWRPTLKKFAAAEMGHIARTAERILSFPRSSAKRSVKDHRILKRAV